ncbi:MAG: DUF3006 domain-containing protein [Ruminococcus sp.]|nr:DUF3006 domain-containing protein [Ruminococcus sp.]
MMKKFTVDQIEGDIAVLECENGSFVHMELASLPKHIHEGDIIRFDADSCFLSAEETDRRRQKIQKLMDKLFIDE